MALALQDPGIPPVILAPLLEAARQRWPDLTVDEAAFAADLLARRPAAGGAGFDWLPALSVPDLYLVSACVAGDPRALAQLERLTATVTRQIVDTSSWSPMSALELRTVVLGSLLVAENGQAPRILSYGGRGSLAGFLRVCAIRIAAGEGGRARQAQGSDLGLAERVLGGGDEVEVDRLKQQYRPEFERVMREALAGLEPRDRNLLRLHHFERLPCERIATLYSVHTTTAWRWIERIHRDLRADILQRLATRLGAALADAESIVRLVWSHVDESLRLVLAEP